MSRTAATTAVDRLRDAVRGRPPLEPLDPAEYALGHAQFESRSDQRARLTRWLVRHLAVRAAAPTRVLSIGCGDGSVDASVAAELASRGHEVDWVGVEPHAPSGRLFLDRMQSTEGVRATLLTDRFDRAQPGGSHDVALAVHSLYYVDDLAATLRRACSLLAPGGELVVLHAPREPLNALIPLLCRGAHQPFADEVVRTLRDIGRTPLVTRIDCRLDLTATGVAETDRRLLDFTVQARVPADLAPRLRDALAERALPGPGLVLPHPLDAIIVQV